MHNEKTAERLMDAIRNGTMPHAVLVTGAEGSDAGMLIKRAAALYCMGEEDCARLASCPDYTELGPEAVPVDAIRNLQLKLAERALSGRRAVVFLEAHHMNQHAQNALLKTLEEPPAHTLMLLAGQEEGLLPTIRSRCAILRLGAEDVCAIRARLAQDGVEQSLAAFAAWLSEGAPLIAREIATVEHRRFFDQAADVYFTAIQGKLPPYADMGALLELPLYTDKEEKSKAAKQRPRADFCLRAWRALARDMLRARLDLPADQDDPCAARVEQEARRFTIAEIQDMIDWIMGAMFRIIAANPSLAMDALITGLTDRKGI